MWMKKVFLFTKQRSGMCSFFVFFHGFFWYWVCFLLQRGFDLFGNWVDSGQIWELCDKLNFYLLFIAESVKGAFVCWTRESFFFMVFQLAQPAKSHQDKVSLAFLPLSSNVCHCEESKHLSAHCFGFTAKTFMLYALLNNCGSLYTSTQLLPV